MIRTLTLIYRMIRSLAFPSMGTGNSNGKLYFLLNPYILIFYDRRSLLFTCGQRCEDERFLYHSSDPKSKESIETSWRTIKKENFLVIVSQTVSDISFMKRN